VSPELLKRKSYNNKIDVWGLGILAYELLFGRVPFEIVS
jgi:serine/threonine protein kinase